MASWFQSTRPRGARPQRASRARLEHVSIHAPTRGATRTVSPTISSACFNPRAHAGRDQAVCNRVLGGVVSIHAPTRGATEDGWVEIATLGVSIHAPTRGATRVADRGNSIIEFQSTRPRGARLGGIAVEAVYQGFNPRAHAGRDVVTARTFHHRAHVSIHAPTRGATIRREPAEPLSGGFNPRAHAGRDQALDISSKEFDVSIHAPTRGATSLSSACGIRLHCFNPRAHAGRDPWTSVSRDGRSSFNPRAHAGRDHDHRRDAVAVDVSIHAPTRGATGQPPRPSRPGGVSIHAPTRGATAGAGAALAPVSFNPRAHAGRDLARGLYEGRPKGFNPRAHAGRDGNRAGSVRDRRVSIHAPTRGATGTGCQFQMVKLFQSTRPRGARRLGADSAAPRPRFQSTRPRGARRGGRGGEPRRRCFNPRAHAGRDPWPSACAWAWGSFNPRAHAGRDPIWRWSGSRRSGFNPRAHAGRDSRVAWVDLDADVSIHAPTRGATDDDGVSSTILDVSIHAPTRGATIKGVFPKGVCSVSIHAPTRGATQFLVYQRLLDCFNPRAHAGRDHRRRTTSHYVGVSIHAPTRGATLGPATLRGYRVVVSIHAPTRGATLGDFALGSHARFQSTRPRGARLVLAADAVHRVVSIHAPTRGATIGASNSRPLSVCFNPRAHAGRDTSRKR